MRMRVTHSRVVVRVAVRLARRGIRLVRVGVMHVVMVQVVVRRGLVAMTVLVVLADQQNHAERFP